MTLLKPEHKTSMLIPFEQLFIQAYHHNGHLITEQGLGESNPLFQLVIDTRPTSAPMIRQTNTLPAAHTNQFHLTHNSGKKQKKYIRITTWAEHIAFSTVLYITQCIWTVFNS